MTLQPDQSGVRFDMAGGDPFEHYKPGARVRLSNPHATQMGTIVSTRGFSAEVLWDGEKKPKRERLMQLSWVAKAAPDDEQRQP